jgi:hypothetical protein
MESVKMIVIGEGKLCLSMDVEKYVDLTEKDQDRVIDMLSDDDFVLLYEEVKRLKRIADMRFKELRKKRPRKMATVTHLKLVT